MQKVKIKLLIVTAIVISAAILCAFLMSSCNQLPKVTEMKFPNTVAENAQISDKYKDVAEELSHESLAIFRNDIVEIPRVSGKEDKMRQYLINFGNQNGFKTVNDPSGIVYIDVPATPGYENSPKVILQAHTDMVNTTKDPNYNMENNEIETVMDPETLSIHSKDYLTNIGADDAEGITTLLTLATNKKVNHGPLRLLFTYEEETTMAGCKNVTAEMLDADYLINVDSGPIGMPIDSSCGNYSFDLSKNYTTSPGKDKVVTEINLNGLLGGHSGVDIHKPRISTKQFLCDLCNKLNEENIQYQFAYIRAGKAENAILNSMTFQIATEKSNADKFRDIVADLFAQTKEKYPDDSDAKVSVKLIEDNNIALISPEDSKNLYECINSVPQGAIEYRDKNHPTVSCNMGVMDFKDGKLLCTTLFRSNIDERIEEFGNQIKDSSEKYKFEYKMNKSGKSWPSKEDNKLGKLFLEAYENVCGFQGTLTNVHAGLECGEFVQVKPGIQVISIGEDVDNEHGVKETWYTKSIPAHFASILYVLENIQ